MVVATATKSVDYVLITAAHNEEAFIGATIESILSQSKRPLRWVIVSDASTDRTDEIVKTYASKNVFIELARLDETHRHDFAAKAHAIKAGRDRLQGLNYGFIGIVDADVSFEPDYYCRLLELFSQNALLGLTGGYIYETRSGLYAGRVLNRPWSVAGAAQLFRRDCFEGIGGILPLKYGGEDSCAEVMARMAKWNVAAIPEIRVTHHRPTGGASGWIRGSFRQGRMDYSLGIHPLFELGRMLRRVPSRPFVLYAGVRLAGFCFSYLNAEQRMVSRDFVEFLRQEELDRLVRLFR